MTGASAPALFGEGRRPGEAVHEAVLERFRRLLYDAPQTAFETYGLALAASVDEADRVHYFQALGLDAETIAGGMSAWDVEFAAAVAAHRKGDLDRAEQEYLRLLRKDTARQEVHYDLAALFLERGNRDRALDHLEKFQQWLAGRPRTPYTARCLALARDLHRKIAPEEVPA